jgi:hypothetical protein
MNKGWTDENKAVDQELKSESKVRSEKMKQFMKSSQNYETGGDLQYNKFKMQKVKVAGLKREVQTLEESWNKTNSLYRANINISTERLESIDVDDNKSIESCRAWLAKLHLWKALEEQTWMKVIVNANEVVQSETRDLLKMQTESDWAYLNARHLKEQKDHLIKIGICEDSFNVHDRMSDVMMDRLYKRQSALGLEGEELTQSQKQAKDKMMVTTTNIIVSFDNAHVHSIVENDLKLHALMEKIASLQEDHKRLLGITITF